MAFSWRFWGPQNTLLQRVFSFVVQSSFACPILFTNVNGHHLSIKLFGRSFFGKRSEGFILNWRKVFFSTELLWGSGSRYWSLDCALWQADAWIDSHIRDKGDLSSSWVVVCLVFYDKVLSLGLFIVTWNKLNCTFLFLRSLYVILSLTLSP